MVTAPTTPGEERAVVQEFDDPAGVEAAERLLTKVRAFASDLDPDERELFAALLGPGVALAHESAEVAGFAATWDVRRLPAHLAEVIRRHDLRIVGL